jgi:hypothetical protein
MRRALVAVVIVLSAGACATVAYAGISGKGLLTKSGGTSYAYWVQFNQPVTGLQVVFKAGVTITSFTPPAGFKCSSAYNPSTKQSAIACPSGNAAANKLLTGKVTLSKPLARGQGASLYEAGDKVEKSNGNKPIGPFPICANSDSSALSLSDLMLALAHCIASR